MQYRILILVFFVFSDNEAMSLGNDNEAMPLSDILFAIKKSIKNDEFTFSKTLEKIVFMPRDGIAQQYYPEIERVYINPSTMDLSIMLCALYAYKDRVERIEKFLYNNAQILRVDQISTLEYILAVPAFRSLEHIEQQNKSIQFRDFYIEKTIDVLGNLSLNMKINFLIKTFAENTPEAYGALFQDEKDLFSNGFVRLFISPCTEIRTEQVVEEQKERHVLFGATRIDLDYALKMLKKYVKNDCTKEKSILALQ